jgi:hypothetical protein
MAPAALPLGKFPVPEYKRLKVAKIELPILLRALRVRVL